MTEKAGFNWDSAPLKAGATADPAAGQNWAAITVPAGKKWVWMGFYTTIVTDGTVISRRLLVSIAQDGTNASAKFYNTTNLTATVNWEVSAVAGTSAEWTSSIYVGMAWPAGGIELPGGAVITPTIVNIQAGDNAGVLRYFYKEVPA